MDRWAYFTLWARRDSRGAAAAFLSEATEEAASRLIGAAHWRDEDVRDFERRELGVLVAGTRWGGGRFWLGSVENDVTNAVRPGVRSHLRRRTKSGNLSKSR